MKQSKKKNALPPQNHLSPTPRKKDIARTQLKAVPADQLKQSLLPSFEDNNAIGELIMTGEAVFALLRFSELDMELRNAFWQLEKQFDFWKELVDK